MPSRAQRRKQSSKNRNERRETRDISKHANKGLRLSAQRYQEKLEDDASAAPLTTCVRPSRDVDQLRELFPTMTGSIIEQVINSSRSIEDAGGKLALMTSPSDADDADSGTRWDGSEQPKIVIPNVDDNAEYPDLCLTVESAYKVLARSNDDPGLALGTEENDGDDDNEDDNEEDDDAEDRDDGDTTKGNDFIMVTDVDLGGWCLVGDTDEYGTAEPKKIPIMAKASYAQAACSF